MFTTLLWLIHMLLHYLYFVLVICRTKVNELSSEIGRFRTEIEAVTQDQSSYVSYEKRYVTCHEYSCSILILTYHGFIIIILDMVMVWKYTIKVPVKA